MHFEDIVKTKAMLIPADKTFHSSTILWNTKWKLRSYVVTIVYLVDSDDHVMVAVSHRNLVVELHMEAELVGVDVEEQDTMLKQIELVERLLASFIDRNIEEEKFSFLVLFYRCWWWNILNDFVTDWIVITQYRQMRWKRSGKGSCRIWPRKHRNSAHFINTL